MRISPSRCFRFHGEAFLQDACDRDETRICSALGYGMLRNGLLGTFQLPPACQHCQLRIAMTPLMQGFPYFRISKKINIASSLSLRRSCNNVVGNVDNPVISSASVTTWSAVTSSAPSTRRRRSPSARLTKQKARCSGDDDGYDDEDDDRRSTIDDDDDRRRR